MPARPARALGFTLIELMVTLSVLALLLALAAPAFDRLVAGQRMRTASYDLVSHLVLARSEALKRGAVVLVQPGTGGWGDGWTVRTPGTDEVLAQRPALGGSVAVTTAPNTITFNVNGRVEANGPVRLGLSDGFTRHRCISLDPTGRPKSVAQECPT